MKNKKFILVFFLMALVTMFYMSLSGSGEKFKIGILVGNNVPEFSFKYVDEEREFTQSDLLEGGTNFKLINFFASWCGTCLMEHNDLLTLSKRSDIEVIGIVWRDNNRNAKRWLGEHGNPYDILLSDKSGRSKFKFGLIGVPESFLIDQNNRILAHYRGPIDLRQLNDFLDGEAIVE